MYGYGYRSTDPLERDDTRSALYFFGVFRAHAFITVQRLSTQTVVSTATEYTVTHTAALPIFMATPFLDLHLHFSQTSDHRASDHRASASPSCELEYDIKYNKRYS